ncbi:hypothetical protein C2E21_5153 [Chlorella sorokiniana]|uniref:MYND-type domain-containing protein n=1 Tax=Chlorella sorokiniana TaxID=3076 RepID=A0A2P6TPX5_CHLSO|nr:hypothetical protein C2E21_5153 [Chlorella sorokiniana]|eukprot:PRW56081.1 hypothetical protein C2E21_5153 [Chlorella sorokiniana]
MSTPGLAAQLEALLQHLAGSVTTREAARAAVVQGDAARRQAGRWRAADHCEAEMVALRSTISDGEAGYLHSALLVQLRLAVLCFQVPPSIVTAAAAEEAVVPWQLVAWVAAAAKALRALGADSRTVRYQRELLPLFIDACFTALIHPSWAAHAAAVRAADLLVQDLVQLSLACLNVLAVSLALPAHHRPERCSWFTVAEVSNLLASPDFFQADLRANLQSASSASMAAAVASAAQLVQQLPLDRPPAGWRGKTSSVAVATITLLSALCGSITYLPAALQRMDGQQQRRAANQLVSAVSRLPQLLALLSQGGQPSGQPAAPPAVGAAQQMRPRPKQLQALCAAHAAALQASEAQHPLTGHGENVAAFALLSLAIVAAHAPLAVGLDLALHRLFGQLWSAASRQGSPSRVAAWFHLMAAVEQGPRLAVLLAAGGYLEAIVKGAGQDTRLLDPMCNVLDALQTVAFEVLVAAGEADGSSSSGGGMGASAAEEAGLLERLRQALQAAEPSFAEEVASARRLQRDMLPPARRLAAALLDWWRRPAAQQEQQLEAAQATAARSCAYLRCVNLGSGGGPAAGQGEGSQRCSACRAVWYCGTACSHANWRAGHKHVCKALGAARAAAKAARRQAVVEAGATQEGA